MKPHYAGVKRSEYRIIQKLVYGDFIVKLYGGFKGGARGARAPRQRFFYFFYFFFLDSAGVLTSKGGKVQTSKRF